MDEGSGANTGGGGAASSGLGLRCDFCGDAVTSVRRVALDQDYDRLQKPHRELYACPSCSDSKERARRGLDR